MAQPSLWGDALQSAFANPMTLGGLSLLAGGDLNSGIQAGAALQRQGQQQRQQQAVQQGLLGLPNLSDSDRQILGNSPELANSVLENIYKSRFDPMAGLDADYKRAQIKKLNIEAAGGGGETPSNIREWNAFQRMTPDEQRQYLTMKRADRYYNLGDQYAAPDPLNPTGAPRASMPINNAAKAADTAAGKIAGTNAANLPGVERNARVLMRDIDSVLNDPYLPKMTGPVAGRLPNISAASNRVQANLDKIAGESFLQAYDQLRGAGNISNAEGEKAEDSLSKLKNTKQGTADYVAALKEFKQDVADLVEVARAKARGGYVPPQTSGYALGSGASLTSPNSSAPSAPTSNGGWSIKRID